MKTYRTTQLLTVGPGTVLQLSEEQLKDRGHQVEALGKGRYRAKALMQFKRGEVLGIEGELAKSQQDLVEPEAEPKREASQPVQTSAQTGGQAGNQGQAVGKETHEKKTEKKTEKKEGKKAAAEAKK
jgi:hypothetical protein